jgi:hypothetical protein
MVEEESDESVDSLKEIVWCPGGTVGMQVHVEFRPVRVRDCAAWVSLDESGLVQSGRTSLIQVDMAAASLILDVNRGRC